MYYHLPYEYFDNRITYRIKIHTKRAETIGHQELHYWSVKPQERLPQMPLL